MSSYIIALPYRRRPNCLAIVLERLPDFLRAQACINDFTIILVEQEDGKPFNFAKLGNVGYDIGKRFFGSTPDSRFINHPVDGIPLAGNYTIPDGNALMICEAGTPEELGYYNSRYAKAHAFHATVFEKINGYSNDYWGWGFDDDDLFLRLEIMKVPILGTFVDFEFFMAHHLKPSDRNRDVQDGISRYEYNGQLYEQMTRERNPFKSGLNTLSYDITEQATLSEKDHFYHFKVAL